MHSQAVAAYRAALEETTRERIPLQWARSQHVLADVPAQLAARQKSAPRMDQQAGERATGCSKRRAAS
jgi:hypothetical protein